MYNIRVLALVYIGLEWKAKRKVEWNSFLQDILYQMNLGLDYVVIGSLERINHRVFDHEQTDFEMIPPQMQVKNEPSVSKRA